MKFDYNLLVAILQLIESEQTKFEEFSALEFINDYGLDDYADQMLYHFGLLLDLEYIQAYYQSSPTLDEDAGEEDTYKLMFDYRVLRITMDGHEFLNNYRLSITDNDNDKPISETSLNKSNTGWAYDQEE